MAVWPKGIRGYITFFSPRNYMGMTRAPGTAAPWQPSLLWEFTAWCHGMEYLWKTMLFKLNGVSYTCIDTYIMCIYMIYSIFVPKNTLGHTGQNQQPYCFRKKKNISLFQTYSSSTIIWQIIFTPTFHLTIIMKSLDLYWNVAISQKVLMPVTVYIEERSKLQQ